MIEINNLSKSYGINKIFENESITLTNSCIYALVGVNGIGKSTFLNSIIQPRACLKIKYCTKHIF